MRYINIADWMTIDGSLGEGGGQILRSSLTLSLVTGIAVRVTNIRAGRDKPGLMRQHLTAVRAAAEVGNAKIEGDEVGSQSLAFTPQGIKPGRYTFSVGTAGSSTLVLQTVLPALMIADAPSEIVLEGGTHNQWAPPYDFLAQAYFPLLREMGVKINSGLERHGFYPAGGGRFSVSIEPCLSALGGLLLTTRGEVLHRSFTAIVANLSRSIAQREIDAAAVKLSWPPDCFHVYEANDAQGPGNVVMAELQCENVTEVFTGFGRQGATSERVAAEAVDRVRAYLASHAPVGKFLADQLLLPLGIAAWRDGARSEFVTMPLTRHCRTQIELLRDFLNVETDVIEEETSVRVVVG